MTLSISPKRWRFRAGARRRGAEQQDHLDERFQLAWKTARQGAEILRTQFQAEKVVVFGSLTDRQLFHNRSDIDLAA